MEKQEREQTLKEQFRSENQEFCKQEEVGRYRVDVKVAYKLWEDGQILSCNPTLLTGVLTLMVPEWCLELQECMEYMDSNFTYEQKLNDIVAQVEQTGAGTLLMPMWSKVKAVQRKTWRRNLRQFLKLMFVGSRTRMVSMLTSAAFSVLMVKFANEQSVCRDGLLFAITSRASLTGQELLLWLARDLGMTYLHGLVNYIAEAVKAFLVKQSSGEMWRLVYAKLVSFDSEIYDRQDVTNYLNLEDAVSDAEAAIQTFHQCAVDLAARMFMMYTRGGWRLSVCVISFWSVSHCVKRPLDRLKDMLAKSDFVGHHDDDELDEDEEWTDEDGLKEEMKDLFEYIRTVRAFGRDKDIMDGILKKKFGRPSGALFELDEFLGYTFPPVKDWVILTIELLCKYACNELLRKGYNLPASFCEMHILIKETWGALCAAPHSLAPSFVLNHVTQVATVMNILDYEPIIEKEGGLRPDRVKGYIELRNVSFAYPFRRDRKILSNLSFTAEPGSMVGLVGPSGSGKSTVFALLMRFYDPTEGQILLDGRDLRDYDVRWLRDTIGEVGQTTQLFEMSVEDNIRFGCTNASREEVVEAAKLANAYRFIMSLPEGFNTILGDNGIRLSGGQMQRISISRAFLSRPRILLLDEYSSALDTQSEMEVQTAVQRLVEAGCTTFVIAHRLATVEHASRIVVLDRGTCVESGTHAELSQLNGMYTQLEHLQQSGSNPTARVSLKGRGESKGGVLNRNPSFLKNTKKRGSVVALSKEEEQELSIVRSKTSPSPKLKPANSPDLFPSDFSASFRLVIANIFETHSEKLGLLKSEILPTSWAFAQSNGIDDLVQRVLDASSPTTQQHLGADESAQKCFVQQLLGGMAAADMSTNAWSRVALMARQQGLTDNDCFLLKLAWMGTLRQAMREGFTSDHEDAWGVAFSILGDAVDVDSVCVSSGSNDNLASSFVLS